MPLKVLRNQGVQLASLMLLLLVWSVLAQTTGNDTIPSPLKVSDALIELFVSSSVSGPLASTFARTSFGFLLGFFAAIVYGVICYVRTSFAHTFSLVYGAAMFAPTLVIIYVTLAMLGHDNPMAVVLISGFVVFTQLGVMTRDALQALDPAIKDMAASYRASVVQRVTSIYLPHLIPSMLAACRIGLSLAWKVTFTCEVFGYASGLGWKVVSAYTVYNMAEMLAWLVLFIAIILIVEQGIRLAEHRIVKWVP